MISIVRLMGESYDFEQGKEMGKCLVLSNGYSEKIVSVSEEQILAVLALFAELAVVGQPNTSQASVTPLRKADVVPNKAKPPVVESVFVDESDEYTDDVGAVSI